MNDRFDTTGLMNGATAFSTAKRALRRERYDWFHDCMVISRRGVRSLRRDEPKLGSLGAIGLRSCRDEAAKSGSLYDQYQVHPDDSLFVWTVIDNHLRFLGIP